MAYTGSKAKVGRGTSVSIGNVTGTGGAEAFTPIEELDESSFSGAEWGQVSTTNFQSGIDEEFISTMRKNGTCTLKGNLIDGAPGQVALNAAYNTGSKYDFQAQLMPGPGQTVGTIYAFSALVSSFFELPITTEGVVTFTAKLTISGPITATVGS